MKNDIVGIITQISKKIIQKELNAEILEKIIKKTIFLLEKKENINVILSEKYARLFLEIQNKKLGEFMKKFSKILIMILSSSAVSILMRISERSASWR